MAICRYFLNGSCRFGDNCRFEHPQQRAEGNSHYSSGNYQGHHNYHYTNHHSSDGHGYNRSGGGQNRQNSDQFDFRAAAQEVEQEKLLTDHIIAEIHHMLAGKQYLYSIVPGFQQKGNFIHLADFSPEEFRARFIESRNTNRLKEFAYECSQLRSQVENTLHQVLANPNILKNSQPLPGSRPPQQFSPFNPISFGTHQPESSQSIFAPPQPHPSHFPSASSIVYNPANVNPHLHQQTSLFGKPIIHSGQNLFGQGFHNVQSQQPQFTQMQTIAQQSGVPNRGVHTTEHPIHHQNAFSTPLIPQHPSGGSIFAPQNVQNIVQFPTAATLPTGLPIATTTTTTAAPTEIDTTYTLMDKLTPADLEAFQARKFTLSSIPLVPPPRELCFV